MIEGTPEDMGQGKSKSKSPSPVGVKLPPIPKDSPLGFMLANWEHFPGAPGKDKAKMIHYCIEVWGGQEISKGVFWPIFGSSEDWVKQLLNGWINTKQPSNPEESAYARVWTEKPEVLVFKLSGVSGGKKKKGRAEEVIIAPPPYIPPAPDAPPPPPQSDGEESDSDSDQPSGSRGPLTRSKTRGKLFPLREMPMGGPQPGIGFISVPLSSGDVRDFKKEMGNLLEDPLGVAERVDQFLGPNIYTWEELQSILNILFTVEEKNMIRTAGMRVWDAQPAHAQHPADTKWPLQNPNWNNQDPAHRANMRDFRAILIDGIKESVPRGQNINKAFNDRQKKDETPTEWLERLRKSFQLYSGLNPNDPMGQAILKVQFVSKSWDDIRRKIQKMDDWQDRDLAELLREAQKVYVRREDESQKRQVKMMVAAVRESRRAEEGQKRVTRNREGDKGKVGERVCYYCGKKGHFKKECRRRLRDEEEFKIE